MTEIQLDARTVAIRTGDDWRIDQKQRDGKYRTVAEWMGNRRTLLHWCEENHVHPSREAESLLAQMPERTAFAPDRD